MAFYFANYFIILATVELALVISIILSTKPDERTATFYIIILSFFLVMCGSCLRAFSFFKYDLIHLVSFSRSTRTIFLRLDIVGILLFGAALFIKPIIISSLRRHYNFRTYINFIILWVLFFIFPAYIFIRLDVSYGAQSNIYSSIITICLLLLLIFEIKKYSGRYNAYIKIIFVTVIFIIIIQFLFFIYYLLLSLNYLVKVSEYFQMNDFYNRILRFLFFIIFDNFIALYWIQNFSTQAIIGKRNQKKIIELLVEKDHMIQNLINSKSLINSGVLSVGLTHEVNQFLSRIQLDLETAKFYLSKINILESNNRILIEKIRNLINFDKKPSALNDQMIQIFNNEKISFDDSRTGLLNYKNVISLLDRAIDANQAAASFILNIKKLYVNHDQNYSKCSLETIVLNVVRSYERRLKISNIEIRLNLDNKVFVNVRESLFCQVISNLISNAIEALDLNDRKNKEILVEVRPAGERCVIDVADNGQGIHPSNFHKVFNLFATTKSEGSGIGLWLSKLIIVQHNGHLTFQNSDGGGVVFSIDIPRATN